MSLIQQNYQSKEYQLRLDWAICRYEQIMDDNIERQMLDLTDEHRASFASQGQLTDHSIRAFLRATVDIHPDVNKSKSALLGRLVDGKEPLKFAPPLSFALPWYDVIEGDGPWNITVSRKIKSVDQLRCTGLDYSTAQIFSGITINQCVWTMLEYRCDTEVVVSYRKWHDVGYTWLLSLDEVKASDSKSAITVNTNEGVTRITTLKQLRHAHEFQVRNHFAKLQWALDAQAAESHVEEGKSLSVLAENTARNQVKEGISMLNERRRNGLGDTPGENEIEDRIESAVASVLKDAYFVNDQGELVLHEWRLSVLTKGESY